MWDIFLSYSRQDLETAHEIAKRLTDERFKVWSDWETLEIGDSFPDKIREGIEYSPRFVIILSQRSAQSYWVMRELTYALEYKKKEQRLIFPLLLDGDPWPLIGDIQWARSLEELIQKLKKQTPLFISAAAEDEEFTRRLSESLERLGAKIWQREGIQDSDEDGLSSCEIMLVVVSPNSMSAGSMSYKEIRRQWEAFQRQEKPIIPILIRHAAVPARLREKQTYIDFLNQDYETAFSQLYGVLESLGVSLQTHTKIAVPPQPPLSLNGFDMVNEARAEIMISGITLDIFEKNPTLLDSAFKNKLKVRLLTIELDVRVANECGMWTGINGNLASKLPKSSKFESWEKLQQDRLTPEGRWVAQRLFHNQTVLYDLWNHQRDLVEIKTIKLRPGTGYWIIDPRLEGNQAMLTATPYPYLIDELKAEQPTWYYTAPIFLSKSSPKASDQWWFERYVEEFERLWKRAKKWEPHPLVMG